jgi:hypothetical protein
VRRLVPLFLAALVVSAGCGTERPAHVRETDASFSPASSSGPPPSWTPSPEATPTPTPTPVPDVHGPLAGFPLALGYAAVNGDDGTPVRVTGKPATRAFGLCGRPAWDPQRGTTDLIGVEFRGEAEWYRGRTLVLFPSDDAAAGALDIAHDAVAACPDESSGEDTGTTHALLDRPVGDQSVVWADTYYALDRGERLHGTGLTVYHLVRVDRAVLLAYEYGEGNGSPVTRDHTISEATASTRALVDRLADCRPCAGLGDTP